MKSAAPCLVLFLLVALGATRTSSAQDEDLAVIVNPGTRVHELSADQLTAIFTMSQREWPGGETIIPFNHEPGGALRTIFDRAVLGMKPDEAARFWIDRRIRGEGGAPRKVPSVALMLRVVAKLPNSIGYVPWSLVTNDVHVVARVSGGKVRGLGSVGGETR
jgi:ABC-type phosphate transport system substrate-binding protein